MQSGTGGLLGEGKRIILRGDHTVPTGPFGAIEGVVGAAQPVVAAAADLALDGDADAYAHRQIRIVRVGETGDAGSDPLADARRRPFVEARKQAGELLTAHSSEQGSGRQHRSRDVTERGQSRIADTVAVAVVDHLEVIEIEQQKRGGCDREALLGPCDQGPAVGDPWK